MTTSTHYRICPLCEACCGLQVQTEGQRVVAVGQRGHVLFSDDTGKSWQQAEVPVSADLVAATFLAALMSSIARSRVRAGTRLSRSASTVSRSGIGGTGRFLASPRAFMPGSFLS